MIKIVCIVLCALVAGSMAQDGDSQAEGASLELVPFAANLCNKGCPVICQSLRTFCIPVPGSPGCDEQLAQCDSICQNTCGCIQKCGPDCDTFEQNCVEKGLPQVAGIFCPINGYICDGVCVVSCPQQVLMGLFMQAFQQNIAATQGFIKMLVGPILQPQS